MKRRNFLGVAALGVMGAIGLLLLDREELKERLLTTSFGKRTRESILGLESDQGVSTLDAAEEAALLRLAAVVLPSGAGEPAHAVVLDRLRFRATTGLGYAHEFRLALALLDDESRKKFGDRASFVGLSQPNAARVVGSLLDGVVAYQLSAASRSDVLRLVVSPRFLSRYRMRRHVVNEMLEAYYRSPLEWGRLGYRSYPGACAGIVLYSQPPGDAGGQAAT